MKAKKLQGIYKTHLSLFSVVLFLTQFTSDSVRKCKNRQRRKRDSKDKRPLMVSLSIDGRRSSLMDTELGRTFDLEVGPVHADCSCSIDTRYCFTYSPFNQSTNVYHVYKCVGGDLTIGWHPDDDGGGENVKKLTGAV